MRHRAGADAADAALEPDRGHMVLAAAVGAAADLDVRGARGVDHVRTRAKMLLEQPAEPARLRDRDPARLGAGAAPDVRDRAHAGEAEAGGDERAIQGPDARRRDLAPRELRTEAVHQFFDPRSHAG